MCYYNSNLTLCFETITRKVVVSKYRKVKKHMSLLLGFILGLVCLATIILITKLIKEDIKNK
jgi:hypothetical protein